MEGDITIYVLRGGKMVKVGQPQRPENANFVITCAYGDWSGFRTLAECERQFPELERAGRPDRFYAVVESALGAALEFAEKHSAVQFVPNSGEPRSKNDTA